jgi:hypothetical protein
MRMIAIRNLTNGKAVIYRAALEHKTGRYGKYKIEDADCAPLDKTGSKCRLTLISQMMGAASGR